MKAIRIAIVILLLVTPAVIRTIWFYQGIYQRQSAVATPNYADLTVPHPPLSTAISIQATSQPKAPLVLFDVTHSNLYLFSEIKPLTEELAALGAKVGVSDYNFYLGDQLKQANAYVIIAPNLMFAAYETAAIQQFVQRGGRVLVISDPTRNFAGISSSGGPTYIQPVDIANFILAPYNIAFNNDYVYNLVENEGNFRNVILRDFPEGILTENIKQVVLYGAHSIKTDQKVLLRGNKDILSSLTDKGGDLNLAAVSNDGSVMAMGDFSFMTAPFNEVADNQGLVSNLARYLLGGTRIHNLADYPYLFGRPVTLLTKQEATVEKEGLNSMSILQRFLLMFNYSFSLSNKPQEDHDLIITSTFKKADEIKEYTQPFELIIKEEPMPTPEVEASLQPSSELAMETATPAGPSGDFFSIPGLTPTPSTRLVITLPGFGKVSTLGIGVLLYQSDPARNTLILLAENPQRLLELANLVSSGSLAGCTILENVAVCPLSGS